MSWIRQRLVDPLLDQLRAGLTPRRLAWSLALGLGLGVFPVLGTTTLLCVGAGLVFRLNQPALQLANYLAYPLQLGLLLPFIRLGDRLFGVPPLPLSAGALVAGFRADWVGQVSDLGGHLVRACVAWVLVLVPVMLLLAWGLTRVLAGLQAPAAREGR